MRSHINTLNYAKLRWLLLIVIIAAMVSPAAFADERQYKIEAAFLYSFFNYITWPGYASSEEMVKPVICVYDNDPLLSYLDYIRTKRIGERELTVVNINAGQRTVNCHLLFMRHRLPLQSGLASTTLTVFKPDDPLDRGGMIELFEDGERLGIKIDQQALENNGFQISSRLLELAQSVR